MYNWKAAVYDREMMREWEETLSTLLVFAALFSAILTAFVIESVSFLSQDESEIIRGVLVTISQQLSNSSVPPFPLIDTFEVPRWAIAVNSVFFASLGLSLLSSFIAVLALQWIREFDRGLANITSPRDRAVKRHYRHQGIESWHFPTLIAILPTILLAALVLFMTGLVIWLQRISLVITIILAVLLILVAIFYLITSLLAAFYPSAPFQSPMSRLFETLGSASNELIWGLYNALIVRGSNSDETSLEDSERGGPRFNHARREDQVILSDYNIPSSALLWVLPRLETTPDSMGIISETFDVLLNDESPAAMVSICQTANIPWRTILGSVSNYIEDQFDPHQADSTKRISLQLGNLSQLVVILGPKAYSPTLHKFLSSGLTTNPAPHGTWIGLVLRYALWRASFPIPADDEPHPKSLFGDIAQVSHKVSSTVILTWLRDIRALSMGTLVEPPRVLHYLSHLCITLFSHGFPFPTKANIRVVDTDVIKEVVITFIELFQQVSNRRLSQLKTLPLHQLLAHLLQGYDSFQPEVLEDKLLLAVENLGMQLISLITINIWVKGDGESQTQLLRTLKCPTTHYLVQAERLELFHPFKWNDSSDTFDPFGLLELIQSSPFRQYLSLREGKLVVECLFGTCQDIPTSASPNTREWRRAVDTLDTIAYCLSPEGYTEEALIPGGDEPLSTVIRSLSCLSNAMDQHLFAHVISRGLGQHILRVFGTSLHRDRTPILQIQVNGIDNPLLKWFIHVLLHWDYEHVLPSVDDPCWDSDYWHILLWCWSNWLSDETRLPSDNVLLLRLAQQRELEWNYDKIILNYFQRGISTITERSSASLLMQAFSTFPNIPHLLPNSVEIVRHIMDSKYSEPADFIRHDGLDWLSALEAVSLLQNSEEKAEQVSVVALLKEFCLQYSHSMSKSSLIKILQSPLVTRWSPNHDVHHFLLVVHKILSVLRNKRRSKEVFPEAAACCAAILNREIIVWWSHEDHWSIATDETSSPSSSSFVQWCSFVRDLVADLRGYT
ncbi:hypothetical protein FRC15_010300 [Serendipita sp. 397]|nr:hypothetical protein FRC15_010300 [Serendipita sp. 397]